MRMVMRWWISGIRFGEIALVSRLRTRDVYFAYLRFLGWLALFALMILVGMFFALIFVGFLFDGGTSQASEIVIVVMLVGFYVVSALRCDHALSAGGDTHGMAAYGRYDRDLPATRQRLGACMRPATPVLRSAKASPTS